MLNIVIVTSGQPSANPRVVKEATALDAAGFKVTVIYAPLSPWADRFDDNLFAETPSITWKSCVSRKASRSYFFMYVRVRKKLLERLYKWLPGLVDPVSTFVLYSQELTRAAMAVKAHLFIGHNLGALPAVTAAAQKWKVGAAFDAEDFHRGEEPFGSWHYRIVRIIEDRYLPRLKYLTAASPLISEAYKRLYPGKQVHTINNVFSVSHLCPPRVNDHGPLKLFWFSQTLGINRGLETIIGAINLLPNHDIELHLLGNCSETYKQQLQANAIKPASVFFLHPVSPEQVFSIANQFDIGLASEVPYCESRNICLTNKLFTYLLASLCVVASNTAAQEQFMQQYPGVGHVYQVGNAEDLSRILSMLYSNRQALWMHKQASFHLAQSSMNWEHEAKLLVDTVNSNIQ